jgi:DNA-binding GntR family transcriptional regulator
MSPRLRRVSRLRLVDDVRRALEESILAGRIRPGERLGETWLAGELHVSRTTVREALLMLERQGHVVSRPRQGTYVMRLSTEDAADLCNVRALLESYAVRVAHSRFEPALFSRLESCIGEMATCRLPEDLPRLIPMDLAFHRLIVDQARSPHLTEVFANLDGQVGALIIRAMERYQLAIADIVAGHRQLLEALQSGDPARGEQAVIDHYVTGESHAGRSQALVATVEVMAGASADEPTAVRRERA